MFRIESFEEQNRRWGLHLNLIQFLNLTFKCYKIKAVIVTMLMMVMMLLRLMTKLRSKIKLSPLVHSSIT